MFIAIVPAHNEEKNIASVVEKLKSHVDEIVVIDDSSEDNTFQNAANAGATVLRHELNRGQGAALETGHCYARKKNADYILHFDGDGQFDARDIPKALDKLKRERADILIGSRFLDSRSNVPWTKKNLLLPIGRFIDRILSRIKMSDTHNGFRILNRRALQNVEFSQDRMAHASELLILVKNSGLKWVEFPVKVNYAGYGQSARNGFCILWDLLVGRFAKP